MFCRVVKFSSVYHLTLYFPRNFGSETTKVYYIGLRGEFSEAHRHGVTICTYEARPMISDHKTDAFDSVSHEIHWYMYYCDAFASRRNMYVYSKSTFSISAFYCCLFTVWWYV